MSANNGIWIIRDISGHCVVMKGYIDDLTWMPHRNNPWFGCRDLLEVYPHLFQKEILTEQEAIQQGIELLKAQEWCEYGLGIIPLNCSFKDVKKEYGQAFKARLLKAAGKETGKVLYTLLDKTGLLEFILIPSENTLDKWNEEIKVGFSRAERVLPNERLKEVKKEFYAQNGVWTQ